jgi:crossover junction endodeoxyribonuclease RuvC
MPNRRIVAVDPGYERLGIAVMEKSTRESVLFSSCFQTSKTLPHPARLAAVKKELERIIEEFKPEALAIETLFFSKNQKTALLVAECRGVILSLASERGLKIYEYSPGQVKIAVTGHGASDKKQVAALVSRLVQLTKIPKYDDEYDAIAIGLTCFATERPAQN